MHYYLVMHNNKPNNEGTTMLNHSMIATQWNRESAGAYKAKGTFVSVFKWEGEELWCAMCDSDSRGERDQADFISKRAAVAFAETMIAGGAWA